MTWNYRVMYHPPEDGIESFYTINEVYYAKDGTIETWAENPASLNMLESSEFGEMISNLKDALDKPILNYDTGKLVDGTPHPA